MKRITVDGVVMAICWGCVLGFLFHLLIGQAGTMLTIVSSVGN